MNAIAPAGLVAILLFWFAEQVPAQEDIVPLTLPDPQDVTYVTGESVSERLPEGRGGLGNLTYTVSGLPNWLSFSPESRVISGRAPDTAQPARNVTYTVMDGAIPVASGASQTFAVAVRHPLPLSLGEPPSLQFAIGEPIEVTLPVATGGEGGKRYTVSGLPYWLSFDPGTRKLLGTAPDQAQSVGVAYTVTDASGTVSSTYVLWIWSPRDTAAIAPDVIVRERDLFTVTLEVGAFVEPDCYSIASLRSVCQDILLLLKEEQGVMSQLANEIRLEMERQLDEDQFLDDMELWIKAEIAKEIRKQRGGNVNGAK